MAPQTGSRLLGRDDFYNSIHPEDGDIATPDEVWMQYNVPQIKRMHELVTDDSEYSQGADLLVRMMSEFAVEGSEFQPSEDEELTGFIIEVLQREVPGLRDEGIAYLVKSIDDFPPLGAGEHEPSHLERDRHTQTAIGAVATRGSFAVAASSLVATD